MPQMENARVYIPIVSTLALWIEGIGGPASVTGGVYFLASCCCGWNFIFWSGIPVIVSGCAWFFVEAGLCFVLAWYFRGARSSIEVRRARRTREGNGKTRCIDFGQEASVNTISKKF